MSVSISYPPFCHYLPYTDQLVGIFRLVMAIIAAANVDVWWVFLGIIRISGSCNHPILIRFFSMD